MPQVLNKQVADIGHGLMGASARCQSTLARLRYHSGMTWTDTPTPTEDALKVMKRSIEVSGGRVAWNGGEFYGPPEHNSLHLLKAYFTKYPEDAVKVVLCKHAKARARRLVRVPEVIRRQL